MKGRALVNAPTWGALDGPVLSGDCIDVMAAIPDCSVDAVVCDPPYGLEFMGKDWDSADGFRRSLNTADVGRDDPFGRASRTSPEYRAGKLFQDWTERWATEALRVLKPGGHLLAFGGTRTYHRLACAIEDAGFEIRDSILAWGFGSGFPKSLSPYRRMTPCPSIESAPHAVRLSAWLPLESSEAREPIALTLVETQPEGELAVAIRTGRADGSLALTVTSLSDFLAADTSLSIESLWSECSGAPWSPASKSTIETATKAITDRRTWKSSALPPTPAITTQGETSPGGCGCHVATVASRSSGGRWSLTDTQRLIATERVTSPLAALKPLGTALKPAFEPIVVARKPLAGTVVENVLEHGTGALNIDGTRISADGPRPAPAISPGESRNSGGDSSVDNGPSLVADQTTRSQCTPPPASSGALPVQRKHLHPSGCGCDLSETRPQGSQGGCPACRRSDGGPSHPAEADGREDAQQRGDAPEPHGPHGAESGTPPSQSTACPHSTAPHVETLGRWPANVVLSEQAAAELDAQTGELTSGFMAAGTEREGIGYNGALGNRVARDTHGDRGGASRFFYCAKTSRAERNAGLEGFEERMPDNAVDRAAQREGREGASGRGSRSTPRANVHPTVKPINLMRWLLRLVTPPGGLVLDPFLGSGSTGCAAALEGFAFVGIEREPEYIEIARARIAFWSQHEGREVEDVLGIAAASERQSKAAVDAGQTSLLEAA